jgi:ABC-type Zn uptake system ZnuABC Zn-binding protein ZnuA
VDNAKAAMDDIAAELGKLDPNNRQAYLDNAAAEKRRLDEADRQVHASIDPVPASKRLFVANHDAFNYFLARYGITLVGDIIPSTDSLAAVRPEDTAKLIAAIKQNHVKAIFTETTISANLAQQIAGETGVRVFDGKLYGDAIGDAGSDGATLEGALAHNGKLMAQAFSS